MRKFKEVEDSETRDCSFYPATAKKGGLRKVLLRKIFFKLEEYRIIQYLIDPG